MKMKIKILTILSIALFAIFFSCKDEIDKPQLAADFEANKHEVKAGETVIFNDASTGNPSRWNWTFEGGTPQTSVLSSPSVVYKTPGTYQVKLMVGAAGDSVLIAKDAFITVGYGEVTADFSASETTVIQGQAITFTDMSKGIPTSWAWEFIPVGGGNTITSNVQNPAVTFENPGIYTVKLKSTNPTGSNEKIKTDLVTIIDASYVEAGFNADFQGTYSGGTIHFKDASLGTAKTWNWTFEGGTPATSSEQNPVVTFGTPGRYKVKLVVANNFKSSEKEVDDYILIIPDDGLAAFYPFDGNANDAGPNKVDASNLGTGTVKFDQMDRKVVNSAALFDGASVLVAPDHNALNFGVGDFSVACWLKTDVTSKMMVWMESGGIKGAGDLQTWMRIGDNTKDKKVRFCVEDATGSNIPNSATGVSDNVWHHVVCTRKGTTSSIYIDGKLIIAKDVATIKEVSSKQPFNIGAQAGAGGTYASFYIGLIDELILYNKALTNQEVIDLYGL